MAAIRTTRSSARPAAVLAVLTLLAIVAALLALSGTAHAQDLELRRLHVPGGSASRPGR